jgi:hypothetical protein
MRRVLSLLVFLIITFAGVSAASAELTWDKLGLDSDTMLYISPAYEQDHSLFSLVDQDLYLSVDEGKTWNKTSTMPVWCVRVEQYQNLYILQGPDRNNLAIYKYNTLVQGDWEKICDAPASTELFTVLNNGTIIAVKPFEISSDWQALRAEKPNYTWQDTGFTGAGAYLESTPDGIVYTRENGTDNVSRSLSYGLTWEDASTSYKTDKFYISPAYTDDNEIYSIINNTINISYDQGESWQERIAGMENNVNLADLAFSPGYKTDQTIYALDKVGHVFISKISPALWKPHSVSIDEEARYEFNTLVVLPGGRLLAGTSDGVYEVTNYISPAQLTTAAFVIGKTTYAIGQQDWLMDTAPYIDKGRTFVPIRYLAYALGLNDDNILWDGTNNEVTLTKKETRVKLSVGGLMLLVNNKPVTMDVPPQIRDSRVFLPARWVAEAFGASVSWDEQKKAVVIEYQK